MHIDVIAFLVVLAGELFNFAKPATALILVVHVKLLQLFLIYSVETFRGKNLCIFLMLVLTFT
jgi:hypothetical protein